METQQIREEFSKELFIKECHQKIEEVRAWACEEIIKDLEKHGDGVGRVRISNGSKFSKIEDAFKYENRTQK